VTETLEGVASLRAAGLPVAAVVANRVTGDRLGSRAGRLAALAKDPAPLRAAAAAAGVELDGPALGTLLGEARDRQRQVTRERRMLKELRDGLDGLPMVALPFLADGAGGPGQIRILADRLAPADREVRPRGRARRAAVGDAGG
jgi:hypothetical protein